jgi:hypothetical protein
MIEPFVALLLTVNALGLDSIDTVRAFRDERSCHAFVNRERRKLKGKIACVPQRRFNQTRDEVFR